MARMLKRSAALMSIPPPMAAANPVSDSLKSARQSTPACEQKLLVKNELSTFALAWMERRASVASPRIFMTPRIV
jgi:hypothetical protein